VAYKRNGFTIVSEDTLTSGKHCYNLPYSTMVYRVLTAKCLSLSTSHIYVRLRSENIRLILRSNGEEWKTDTRLV